MTAQPALPEAEAFRLMRAGRLADALMFAERAVAGKTVCSPSHGLLATILLSLGRRSDAEAVVETAMQCAPGVADAYDALAYVASALGRHERANALYGRAVERDPGVPRHWYNLASSERSLGRLAEAEAACDRAIALDARAYPSYLLRSELRVQTPAANHVYQLQRELARPGLEDRARVFLGYALGKELDDLGRYPDAFGCFAQAASTRRRHLAYDVAVDERKLRRIAEVFPRDCSRAACAAPDESSRYVFIVGLPRSGTTLVERILTALPGARSNGETEHFSRALLAASPQAPRAADSDAADIFSRAAAADWDAVAAGYARLAGAGRCGEIIIEKLPLNYLYLGAIQRALPQARLVLVSRSPLDGCFAMYRTLFGEAYPFSYDFQDLTRYYAAYATLIEHWRHALGESIHEVRYEELVADPRRAGAALARACRLEWNDCAVAVEKNAAVSFTASASQVRRPIYRSAAGRWRHYRAQLEPLIAALRLAGVPLTELD
ncbi:MAG TPA: sulfotransferase [Steroidobacteraceae bacterium]|jgi:tetratricopeptide (TPR) repeat protein|nr:sulfotransferase [Steroidobacteraceae bacterium]